MAIGGVESLRCNAFASRALLPFALPILYAMLSLGTWTVAPATGRMAWVRIGLYTGVLLSLHFMVLSFFVFNWGMLVTALIVFTLLAFDIVGCELLLSTADQHLAHHDVHDVVRFVVYSHSVLGHAVADLALVRHCDVPDSYADTKCSCVHLGRPGHLYARRGGQSARAHRGDRQSDRSANGLGDWMAFCNSAMLDEYSKLPPRIPIVICPMPPLTDILG